MSHHTRMILPTTVLNSKAWNVGIAGGKKLNHNLYDIYSSQFNSLFNAYSVSGARRHQADRWVRLQIGHLHTYSLVDTSEKHTNMVHRPANKHTCPENYPFNKKT